MLKVYQTYADRIRALLMEGDIQYILAKTGLKYDKVRRILLSGKATKESDADRVIELAIQIIDERALAAKQVVADFSEAKQVEMLFQNKLPTAEENARQEAIAEIRGQKLVNF